MSNKYKLPKFRGLSGATFIENPFMNGDAKTYFGPRQPIDYSFQNYYPPEEWPTKGSLLRPPQVAWLAIGSTIRFPDDPPDLGLSDREHLRRTAMYDCLQKFLYVKSEIERLRPGRTWVEILDFTGLVPLDDSNSYGGVQFADIRVNAYEVPGIQGDERAGVFPWMPFPIDDSEVFFGSEFLLIFCGLFDDLTDVAFDLFTLPFLDISDPDIDETMLESLTTIDFHEFEDEGNPAIDYWNSYNQTGIDIVVEDIASSDYYYAIIDRVQHYYPKFVKYESHIHLVGEFNGYKMDSSTEAIAREGASSDEQEAVEQTYARAWLDVENTAAYGFSDKMCQRMSEDLYDYGFRYMPGGVSDLSAEDMIAEIAEFFGFDSFTGVDLG